MWGWRVDCHQAVSLARPTWTFLWPVMAGWARPQGCLVPAGAGAQHGVSDREALPSTPSSPEGSLHWSQSWQWGDALRSCGWQRQPPSLVEPAAGA